MPKFQPGQGGRKPGSKNKKKVIKVADFVAENDINVPKLWLEAIMAILEPEAKAKALAEFNKWVATMPKERDESDDNPPYENYVNPTANVLNIISGGTDGVGE